MPGSSGHWNVRLRLYLPILFLAYLSFPHFDTPEHKNENRQYIEVFVQSN